jgi:hypothetical protein
MAPRPLKKARRMVSPTQIVSDAVQPKALKQARRAVYRTVNPIEGLEGLAGDAVVRGRRRSSRAKRTSNGAGGVLIVFFVVAAVLLSVVWWAVSSTWHALFPAGAPSNDPVAGHVVAGYDVSLRGLRFSDVRCAWAGDHVRVRMTVRNSFPTRRVVTVSPEYELDDGPHGSSSNDYAERNLRAKSAVSISADAGLPHRGSAVIDGQPPIKKCRPTIVAVQGA